MDQNNTKHGWNLHFSSLVIGFLLATCLALALGAATYKDSGGPYQISATSDFGAFVIDTQSGQMWQVSRSDNINLGTPHDRKSRRKSITAYID